MKEQKTLTPVPFYGDTIFTVEHDGEPYAPVRPIIENMGLAWPPQHEKLRRQSDRWGVMIIVTPSPGGHQDTVCIPVRKLAGFLATINHNKVRNELRSKVLAYQRECDDVLWAYWSGWRSQAGRAADDMDADAFTEGIAAGALLSVTQRIQLMTLAVRMALMTPADRQEVSDGYKALCQQAAAGLAETARPEEKTNGDARVSSAKTFWESQCVFAPGREVAKSDLYDAYVAFADQQGIAALAKNHFFKLLYEHVGDGALSSYRPSVCTTSARRPWMLGGIGMRRFS